MTNSEQNSNKNTSDRKLIGMDLFAGAGGLSLGAEMVGITMRYAVELDESAARTYRRNHKGVVVKCEDIQKINTFGFVGDEKPFIIMGGPPCQGFSMSNTMNRNMNNPKNLLFREFVRFVRELCPEWFVFENVWGLTKMENGKTQIMIEKCFEELGYAISSKVLCASDYGVPQNRERFFMVGNSKGIKYEFPEQIQGKVTVREAIEDLPKLENGDCYNSLPYSLGLGEVCAYAKMMRKGSRTSKQNYVSHNNDLVIERYKYIGQGQNWRSIPDYLMKNYGDKSRTHSGIYRRLEADKPSIVISNYRKSMLIHPFQNRGLSVREAARIQSFPDTFLFEGSLSHIQQQIGNAVPPLLAKAVVGKILAYGK